MRRVEGHLDGVASALARDARRRKYNVRFEVDAYGPEGSPIYLSDDPEDMDEPISARWTKEHKVHIRFPGGTAKDLMRVSKATRSALGKPANARVRKTRAQPPRPASPRRFAPKRRGS